MNQFNDQHSFLILTNSATDIWLGYFHAPTKIYYTSSLYEILAKFNFLYFLHCQGITRLEVHLNLLEQVNDPENFHQHFQNLYAGNDNDCLVENDQDFTIALIDSPFTGDNYLN